MKRYMTGSYLLLSRRLSDLWQLTFWRKLSWFEKSKDCRPSSTVEDTPETCSSSTTATHDDPCSPCPPPEKQDPPCSRPCPEPPTFHPDADPRKARLWKTLTLFVALPLVMIMSVRTYIYHREEAKKPRPPFLNLPYMHRVTKPFPWGDGNHTLFHNPEKNPIPPHGYEVEDPSEKYREKTDN